MNTNNLATAFRSEIIPSENEHLRLDHCGWEKSQPNSRVYCYRNLYLIYYINSGAGTLTIDHQSYFLNTGDAFIIRPNQSAMFYPAVLDPWEYFYFAFDGTMVEDLLKETVFQSGDTFCHLKTDEIVTKILAVKNRLENSVPNSIYSLELLSKLLSCFIPTSDGENAATGSNTPTISSFYAESVQNYIYNNYQNPISVAGIAKELNINRSLLYSYFKKETGMDILSYLIEVRMQRARDWLIHTDLTGNTIANMIGYNNYTSFQRAFTQKNGMTPGQYRKLKKPGQVDQESVSVLTDETYIEAKSGRTQGEQP